jgi:ABC-type branched-subunit amino acid transport system substrate-binding protein
VSLAIGSVSSPASLAAAQVFREEELPQIVVSGTAQRITTQGNEWVFRSRCRTASSSATWSTSSTRKCRS